MDDIQRDLGRHDAQIENLEKDILDMRKDLNRLMEKIDNMNLILEQAKGGWKVLMMVGGLSAVIGGVIVKVVAFLWGGK
jgi:archaellum component FlaC